jgi:hypothetical protein
MKQMEPPLKTVDLFAGASDLSLGQAAARFRAEAAVELDPTPTPTPRSGFFVALPEQLRAWLRLAPMPFGPPWPWPGLGRGRGTTSVL